MPFPSSQTKTGTQLAQCVLRLIDLPAMSSCASPTHRLTNLPLWISLWVKQNVGLPPRRPRWASLSTAWQKKKVTRPGCYTIHSLTNLSCRLDLLRWELSPVPFLSQGQHALHLSRVTTHSTGSVSRSRPINNRSNQQWCWLFSTDETDEQKGRWLHLCAMISVAQ